MTCEERPRRILTAVAQTSRGDLRAVAWEEEGRVLLQGEWADGDTVTRVDVWDWDGAWMLWLMCTPARLRAGVPLRLAVTLRPDD